MKKSVESLKKKLDQMRCIDYASLSLCDPLFPGIAKTIHKFFLAKKQIPSLIKSSNELIGKYDKILEQFLEVHRVEKDQVNSFTFYQYLYRYGGYRIPEEKKVIKNYSTLEEVKKKFFEKNHYNLIEKYQEAMLKASGKSGKKKNLLLIDRLKNGPIEEAYATLAYLEGKPIKMIMLISGLPLEVIKKNNVDSGSFNG